MPDLFRDFTPSEIAEFGRKQLQASKDKMPKHFMVESDQMVEGYRFLSGEIEDSSELKYGTYCNTLYRAYKSFAPKWCNRPPNFLVRPSVTSLQPLATAAQSLFRYRSTKFEYQRMIGKVCQDSLILGIGYGRHSWDEKRGLTVTSRFKPQHVAWDASATSIDKCNHVIEKHTIKRFQFAKKYGKDLAYELPASDKSSESSYWPAEELYQREGKSPNDEIEYYLLWSRYDDHRRVYAFHQSWDEDFIRPASSDSPYCEGEEWPFELEEDEWHLTPLVLSELNDRIEGISPWRVSRGQYLMFQSTLGASVRATLEACKKFILYPDALEKEMAQIRKSGGTLSTVPYSIELLKEMGVSKIEDLISKFDVGVVSPDLLNIVQQLKGLFEEVFGVNAVSQINPQGVETAAEATKLSAAADNAIADDQGAVERWMMKVGRKELMADMTKMPRLTVGRIDEFDGEESPEGEFPDEPSSSRYLQRIPAADAVLLEKGPANERAALRMEAARESARKKAWYANVMQMPATTPPENVPVTPEVEVRQRYGVPMEAKFTITNPGLEMLIGPEKSAGWQEGMTRRQIETGLAVKLELMSSSANGRMQKVQEILMTAKTLMPLFQEFQLTKQLTGIVEAIVSSSELESLEECRVTLKEFEAATLALQQQQQAAAQAQAAAKQPQGDNPEVVRMQTDAEKAKAQSGVVSATQKTRQIELKNEGDAARDRSRNQSQLMMASTMNGANGFHG